MFTSAHNNRKTLCALEQFAGFSLDLFYSPPNFKLEFFSLPGNALLCACARMHFTRKSILLLKNIYFIYGSEMCDDCRISRAASKAKLCGI